MAQEAKHSRLLLSAAMAVLLTSPVWAKTAAPLSIEERQEQLMSNINQSQQGGELTAKEARKLRSELADMAHKKSQIKLKKNTNKISDDERLKFESQLNKISVEINKLKLEKRVHQEDKDKVREAKDKSKAKAEAKSETKSSTVSKSKPESTTKSK